MNPKHLTNKALNVELAKPQNVVVMLELTLEAARRFKEKARRRMKYYRRYRRIGKQN